MSRRERYREKNKHALSSKQIFCILFLFAIISKILFLKIFPANDVEDHSINQQSETAPVENTFSSIEMTESTTPSNDSSLTEKNINDFKQFLSIENTDFEKFVDQYYSIDPPSDQLKVFDELIRDKKFTFTGTVIEPMTHRVAIIADSKFSNEDWTTSISSTPLVPYVIFVKNIDDTSQFTIGDHVMFSGVMSSPGANLESMYAQWDMVNGEIFILN